MYRTVSCNKKRCCYVPTTSDSCLQDVWSIDFVKAQKKKKKKWRPISIKIDLSFPSKIRTRWALIVIQSFTSKHRVAGLLPKVRKKHYRSLKPKKKKKKKKNWWFLIFLVWICRKIIENFFGHHLNRIGFE